MGIKRGVSLYSYREEIFYRKMTLKDCIKEVNAVGATGIEILPEQMIDGYPNLSDEFLENWFGWMKQYKTTPTCLDAFLDARMFSNCFLSDIEQINLIERDLLIAKQLGCFVVNALCTTPVRVIERVLPLAERYGIKIGLEIRCPLDLASGWFDPYLALIDRYGNRWLGIIPDMLIFEKSPSRIHRERFVRAGANSRIVEYITMAFLNGETRGKIEKGAHKLGGNVLDMAWIDYCFRTQNTDPKVLYQHKKHIFHVHARFYDMLSSCTDDCFNYGPVVQILQDVGYKGYLSSEYEGGPIIRGASSVDSVEQVSRQQKMIKRLLYNEVVI